MTTIAWDGTTLAADTLLTGGYAYHGYSKVYRFRDGSVGAFSGDVAAMQAAQRWLDSISDVEPVGEWTAIRVFPDGSATLLWDNGCVLDITGRLAATGSGQEFALGAMASGKSPKEAVEIAARYDVATGGPVETISVADLAPVRRGRGKTTKATRP